MGMVTTLSLEMLRAGALAQLLPSKFNIPVSLLCCPDTVTQLYALLFTGQAALNLTPLAPASLVLVLCLCRFSVPVLKVLWVQFQTAVWADLTKVRYSNVLVKLCI